MYEDTRSSGLHQVRHIHLFAFDGLIYSRPEIRTVLRSESYGDKYTCKYAANFLYNVYFFVNSWFERASFVTIVNTNFQYG